MNKKRRPIFVIARNEAIQFFTLDFSTSYNDVFIIWETGLLRASQ